MKLRFPSRGCLAILTILLLGAHAPAEVTGVRIVKDETLTNNGKPIRHLTGVILGKATRNEPSVPTLEHVAGLTYESDFQLWLPVDEGTGRFWFSVLNRGNESSSLRDPVLRRGGAYGWCAWQAKNVSAGKPQLKFSGFDGPLPQAYGLVVVRDFVRFLRSASATDAAPNPAAGKVKFAFATGVSQSGRLMRTFLRYGLNQDTQGKVFDGFLPNGARAGYLDLFKPDSDPGSGATFSDDTVRPPYSWSELMTAAGTDAKVIALNAESEYFQMMAYMTHRGPVPDNVRVYDFPLSSHGGGGAVPWSVCNAPLSLALEEWACHGTPPPASRMFKLEKRDDPRVKHLPNESADAPVYDELGITVGGLRLPPVEVPTARYAPDEKGVISARPLDRDELVRRYSTPENYRKKVAECTDRLIHEGFLPESARAKYVGDAEKVTW